MQLDNRLPKEFLSQVLVSDSLEFKNKSLCFIAAYSRVKSLVQVLKDTNKKAPNDLSLTSRFTFQIIFCLSVKQRENMTCFFKVISRYLLNQEIKDTLGLYVYMHNVTFKRTKSMRAFSCF